jgi:hypothetical protein
MYITDVKLEALVSDFEALHAIETSINYIVLINVE